MKELKAFGLSDHEIELYITLLKLGPSSANRVATVTGMKRSTTYDNLALLMNKGIVASSIKEKTKYFQAAAPARIIQLLDERKEQIERILPELEKFESSHSTPSFVSYYEGKKGAISVLNDIFLEKEELLFYGSRQMAKVVLAHFPESFAQKRAVRKIRLKAVLAAEDRVDPFYKQDPVKHLSKVRFSKSLDGVGANVFIYCDRVSFLTSREQVVGVIIKNKEIVEQQRRVFDLLWKMAEKK